MKIGIIGATGKAGSKILKEAKKRNHEVTAIVRDPSKLDALDTPVIQTDIFNLTSQDIESFDVVVNAFGAPPGQEDLHVTAGQHLIQTFEPTDTRLIVVGGAGSLYVDEDKKTKLLDTPDFPEAFYPTASSQARNLEDLQASAINWTFASPSANFDPNGRRTGQYTIGNDVLLTNDEGESYVSYADFAYALLDEIENPSFEKQRFTVVSEKGLPVPSPL
ncbi:NAD(P)-dependent oxidoreductase [Kurthia massiliensis]|uniref:NAD(P)-dependent oxidoreductase n=1 Tax=Kurthia massiliensis TaxID=1033739 RepID=UPI0002880E30|nr:NAD(P)-dependent oxidoreductase [Kurthia massiliensis]